MPKTGKPSYIAPVLEAPLVQNESDLVTIHAWAETESPAELLAKVLAAQPGVKLAVGDQLWSVFLLRLQAAVPGATGRRPTTLCARCGCLRTLTRLNALRRFPGSRIIAWGEFIEGGPISGLTETQAMAVSPT